ncbi:MAG: diguanylate cyclase [Parasulfuritortus sp.]|nr:diguanylate cyclase [Parasulfuritortus sp.]
MRHFRPARRYLLAVVVVLCTTSAIAWLWRNISHIETALPLVTLHKERDFSAFHFDLARLESALKLAVAAPSAEHLHQASFALDLNQIRLADNRALYGASDAGIAAMQQRLGSMLHELERTLAEPTVDTRRLQTELTDLSRLRLEFQTLNDTIFQDSMDQVSRQRQYLTSLRDSMSLLIGLFGLAGLSLLILMLKQQRAIQLLERQGEDLRLQEQQLIAREREFRMLAENSPDPIIRYDRNCRRIYVNPALARSSGMPASELIGKSLSERPAVVMNPAAAAHYEANVRKVLATGEPSEWEIGWPMANGDSVSFQIRAVPEFNAAGELESVLAVARDITERKRAEERQRLAASVFTTSQEGIVIADAANRIVDINEAFTRITGYRRAEVLGQNPKMLRSGRQDKAFYEEMWRVLRATDRWRGEVWNRRRTGEIYAELLSIVAVRDELGRLLNYVGVFSDISRLKEHEAELDRIAHYDPLTGVPNRRLFSDRLSQAIARARRTGQSLAVCFLDLDGFKPINDQLGHEAGDQVLVEVSHHLRGILRAGDTLARIGGDEFVLLFTDLAHGRECLPILDRLLTAIAAPTLIAGTLVSVSASIGVTLFPDDDSDPDTLLRHADQAMYRAKEAGRNRYQLYNTDGEFKDVALPAADLSNRDGPA